MVEILRLIRAGDYDIDIDELLKGKPKPPESQFTKARRLIETKLANGPVPAADMEEMAEEQGISPKTMSRAKSALGVQSIKRDGRWYWELPIEAEYTVCDTDDSQSQDGHASPVTTLTLLPAGSTADSYICEDGQDGQTHDVAALTTLPEREVV